MLKHGEVNPLNVFGLRQLLHCPPHFTQVSFDLATSEKRITDWVHENLAGRFYFGDYIFTDNEGTKMSKCVAFEIAAEASYFSLFLDKVNCWNNDNLQ
jgi:hypothetical protein